MTRPQLAGFQVATGADGISWAESTVEKVNSLVIAANAKLREIDASVYDGLRKSDEERASIEKVAPLPLNIKVDWPAQTRDLYASIISYGIGVLFGRWDVRMSIDKREHFHLSDPFAAIPAWSPGRLQVFEMLTPDGYPAHINWDGIMVDDPEHPEDLLRRLREILELIWKERAELIEENLCEILGFRELRDYFRKPGAGGFWDDHVKRYSKGTRKAPIYWLLQSSKKNYALWLYYHRLDKDLPFKALLNYVEPKIRLEENRLESLRSQKAAGGESGRTKKLDKEIERQEDLLSELRDFKDKLQRVANLHLEPDLNDGVVLNIAPLWELVPWKEAKNYWEELIEGDYEWSSIGKQLREKGLVQG